MAQSFGIRTITGYRSMDSQIATGHRLLVAVIVYILLTNLAANSIAGVSEPGFAVFNTLFLAVLCIFIYRRANWARWVLSTLYVLSSLMMVFSGLSGLVILGLVNVLVPVVLFSPAVEAYLRNGRR